MFIAAGRFSKTYSPASGSFVLMAVPYFWVGITTAKMAASRNLAITPPYPHFAAGKGPRGHRAGGKPPQAIWGQLGAISSPPAPICQAGGAALGRASLPVSTRASSQEMPPSV